MSALQREILRSASTVVKPGGILVYRTCSLETGENDTQVERFLTEHKNWRLDPPTEGAVPATVLHAGRVRVVRLAERRQQLRKLRLRAGGRSK